MKSKTILFILLFYAPILAHDIPMADFILSQNGDKLLVDIQLDKADFEQAYTNKGQLQCSEQEDTENLMKDYLRSHLTVEVNKKILYMRFLSINHDNHHDNIKVEFLPIQNVIQSIHIKNTCIIEINKEHSNVITAHINGKMRGFRMTEKRTFIDIIY